MPSEAQGDHRSTLRFFFRIGELGVELRISQPSGGPTDAGSLFYGVYDFLEQCEPIGLVIELERVPNLSCDQVKGAVYPAFGTTSFSPTELHLQRHDARGCVHTEPGQPVRAVFQTNMEVPAIEGIIRVGASMALLQLDSLILHSSAVADKQGVHVFSGVSGAGKSTIAAMLSSHYPVTRVADELVMLQKHDGQWHVVAAPFAGKVTLPKKLRMPLLSLNFLCQRATHKRSPIRAHQAMREIARHVLTYSRDPESSLLVLKLLGDMVESTPCYSLEFAKSFSVGELLDLSC